MSIESLPKDPYTAFVESDIMPPEDGQEYFRWCAKDEPPTDEAPLALRHNVAASLGVEPMSLAVFCGNELWSNASKYSHLRGVRVRLVGRTAIIEVYDDGLPADQMYTRPEGEGGLGLSAVHELANGQCGRDVAHNMMWCAIPLELDDAA
jgi:hypothetical protein